MKRFGLGAVQEHIDDIYEATLTLVSEKSACQQAYEDDDPEVCYTHATYATQMLQGEEYTKQSTHEKEQLSQQHKVPLSTHTLVHATFVLTVPRQPSLWVSVEQRVAYQQGVLPSPSVLL
jgi:hypothetical protein